MLHQPLPSTTASNSPANNTFELLKERLEQAESEAHKLSSQLVSYGFKTLVTNLFLHILTQFFISSYTILGCSKLLKILVMTLQWIID